MPDEPDKSKDIDPPISTEPPQLADTQPVTDNPPPQAVVSGSPRKSKKWLLLVLVILLLVGGGAYAWQKHRESDKQAAQTKTIVPQTAPTISFLTYKVGNAHNFSIGVKSANGKINVSKDYDEYQFNYKVTPDNQAAIMVSSDTNNEVHFRSFSKSGQVREMTKYKMFAAAGESNQVALLDDFIGQTSDFVATVPADNYNAKLIKVDNNGKQQTLLAEPRDFVYSYVSLTPDGSALLYNKISAKGESCGGANDIKLPDYFSDGSILELHKYDLKSGKDVVLIQDARKPLGTKVDDVGLDVQTYSADGKMAYLTAAPHGCGGPGVSTQTFSLDLSSKEVKEIPMQYAYGWMDAFGKQGQYVVFTQPSNDQNGDKTKVLLVNLKTAQQQVLTLPGDGKQDLDILGSVIIDGQEKFVFKGPNGDTNAARETITLLNPRTAKFEHTAALPLDTTTDNKCSVNFDPFVSVNKLVFASGCSAYSLDLTTGKISTQAAPANTSAVLY